MRTGATVETLPAPGSVPSNKFGIRLSAASLLCVLGWIGHRLVFAQFQGYDDEGYLLVTVRQFLQGFPLYDDVYTQYGPAYYLWQQVLHGILRIPVTHDATRVVTLVVWLGGSALAAIPVWLLTRRLLLTAIGMAIAFFHMTQLTFEPGHPQELCLVGVVGAVAIVTWRLVARGRLDIPTTAVIATLAAVTALTKVNVGGFLLGAMTLGLVTSVRRSPWRNRLVRFVATFALATVPVLMYRDLSRPDIASWVVVVWSGLLAVLLAGSDAADEGVINGRELMVFVAGAAIVSVLLVVAILAEGTSLRALFEGLFVWPLRLPAVFWRPLPVSVFAASWAALWLAVAVCQRRIVSVRRWMPSISLVFGLMLFLLSIIKAYGLLLALGPPLVWLLLRDPSSLNAGERAARRILAFTAILTALQAYPMPDGTQIVVGTLLFPPIGLVMLADAQREFSDRQVRQTAPRSLGRRAALSALALLVTAATVVRVQRLYADAVPILMPGAEAVRANERDAATYWWLVTNLREQCDAFLTAPGLNSLHFWTGISPVSTLNATLWPILFDTAQQQRILARATSIQRLCVAWDPRRMEVLMRMPDTGSGPLVAWLVREFEPYAAFGEWEFRMRRGTRPTRLYQGQWLDDGRLILDLPQLGNDPIARIAVVDVDAGRTLGDSADASGLVASDEEGARGRIERRIDVSRSRRLVLSGVVAPSAPSGGSVVLRLWTGNGRLLAIVPVVTSPPPRKIIRE